MKRKSRKRHDLHIGKYDWKERYKTLTMYDSNQEISLLLGGKDSFKEMYKLGFLYGQALKDAEEIFNSK